MVRLLVPTLSWSQAVGWLPEPTWKICPWFPAGLPHQPRVSGVPCQAVGAPKILPSDAAVQSFRCEMLLLAIAYWLVVVPMTGSIRPFIRVLVLSQAAQESDSKHWENLDALPEEAMDFLPELPLVSFIVNVLLVALQLLMTILICRLLPRVKPPCSYSLTSIHGMMLSLKMLWVTNASKSLEDASMVPAFMRMCGAQFGRGVVMGCEVVLPDTLVVGNGCFIASRNILTSANDGPGSIQGSLHYPPGSLGEVVRGKEWFDLVALLFAVLVSLPIA